MKSVKLLLAVGIVALFAGCSSTNKTVASAPAAAPNTERAYPLLNYRGPEAMDNNEVVQASRQCILYKMRPNVNYLSVRTEHGKTLVPVSVICEPF